MKTFQRMLCGALAALTLLLGSMMFEGQDAQAAENGMVRIHLTRLGAPSSLSFTTTCAYTISAGGGKIQPGDSVKATVSGGKVVVTVDGAKRASAEKLTLSRSKAGAYGIQFKTPSQPNLYCGDLILTAVSGKPRPVLSIFVEDYLYGVVGYEMSDGYPLEALKAQAVCARNYALAKKKDSGAFDMVDTATDQMFKGYDPKLKNVIKAVDQTRGMGVFYKGKYCPCYFGASNGGQIETTKNMWGSATGYSVMKDDPYDLENPESPVRTLSVSKRPAEKALNAKLKTELVKALSPTLSGKNLKTGESAVQIREIKSITPSAPRFPEPSRTFTKLVFVMDVTGIDKDSGADVKLDGVSCELKTYDNLKARFSLGMQTSNREIISVADKADAFVIEFRRWGHGIGLSQKGAQWMAKKYAKDYKEILNFYFAGIEIKPVSLVDTTGGQDAGAGPVEETGNAGNAENTGNAGSDDGTGSSEDAIQQPKKLRTLKKGMKGSDVKQLQKRLKQLGYFQGSIGGNYQSQTIDAARKFQRQLGLEPTSTLSAALQRLIYAKSAPKASEAPRALKLKVSASSMPVRKSANTGAKALCKVGQGEEVTLLSISKKWCRISYNGKFGYALNSQMRFE